MKKARLIGRVLSWLPFVRAVILNGSLASGGHKSSSDIDILIIAEDGRIFSARFLVNLLAVIIRVKRPRDERADHAGKFCFNYFLTRSYLQINYPKEREEYCAHNYAASILLAGDRQLFAQFLKTNEALFTKYNGNPQKSDCHSYPEAEFGVNSGRNLAPSSPNSFESWARAYQVRKIEADPITKKFKEEIVYNDRELRFHPKKRGK